MAAFFPTWICKWRQLTACRKVGLNNKYILLPAMERNRPHPNFPQIRESFTVCYVFIDLNNALTSMVSIDVPWPFVHVDPALRYLPLDKQGAVIFPSNERLSKNLALTCLLLPSSSCMMGLISLVAIIPLLVHCPSGVYPSVCVYLRSAHLFFNFASPYDQTVPRKRHDTSPIAIPLSVIVQ